MPDYRTIEAKVKYVTEMFGDDQTDEVLTRQIWLTFYAKLSDQMRFNGLEEFGNSLIDVIRLPNVHQVGTARRRVFSPRRLRARQAASAPWWVR